MDTAIWVVLIPTVPTTLIAIGKGVAYVISLIQGQHKSTVDAKNEELKAKDETIKLRDARIAILEAENATLRKNQKDTT